MKLPRDNGDSMSLTPEERRKIYEEEKVRIEAHETIKLNLFVICII